MILALGVLLAYFSGFVVGVMATHGVLEWEWGIVGHTSVNVVGICMYAISTMIASIWRLKE